MTASDLINNSELCCYVWSSKQLIALQCDLRVWDRCIEITNGTVECQPYQTGNGEESGVVSSEKLAPRSQNWERESIQDEWRISYFKHSREHWPKKFMKYSSTRKKVKHTIHEKGKRNSWKDRDIYLKSYVVIYFNLLNRCS